MSEQRQDGGELNLDRLINDPEVAAIPLLPGKDAGLQATLLIDDPFAQDARWPMGVYGRVERGRRTGDHHRYDYLPADGLATYVLALQKDAEARSADPSAATKAVAVVKSLVEAVMTSEPEGVLTFQRAHMQYSGAANAADKTEARRAMMWRAGLAAAALKLGGVEELEFPFESESWRPPTASGADEMLASPFQAFRDVLLGMDRDGVHRPTDTQFIDTQTGHIKPEGVREALQICLVALNEAKADSADVNGDRELGEMEKQGEIYHPPDVRPPLP